MTNQNQNNKRKRKSHNTWIEFTQIAIQMGVVITAGVLTGQWLDEKYPNNHQVFTIILSLFAVFAALYMVIKKAMRMTKQDEESNDT